MCDRASLRRVFAFRFDRKGVPAKYVEMPLGERLLVELAAFCRRRDGIEHAGVGDSRFGVIRDKLVPIRGDADPWVARFLDHDSLEDSEFPADTKTAFARSRDARERVRSRLPCLRASSIIWTLSRPPIGTGRARVDGFQRAAMRWMAARPRRIPRTQPF